MEPLQGVIKTLGTEIFRPGPTENASGIGIEWKCWRYRRYRHLFFLKSFFNDLQTCVVCSMRVYSTPWVQTVWQLFRHMDEIEINLETNGKQPAICCELHRVAGFTSSSC